MNHVAYTGTDAPFSNETFLSQVRAKYGEPVNEDPRDLRWCTMKAPTCEDPREAQYPILAVWTSNRLIQLVGTDPGREGALKARLAADIDSRRPAEAPPGL